MAADSEWLNRKKRIDPLLLDLKAKLAESKERFTPDILEKAHKAHYKKGPGIISMVKHAAEREQPLVTAEDRIGRAFDKLTARKTVPRAAASLARPYPRASGAESVD